MKICSNCKIENKDTANFCRQCGFVFSGVKLSGSTIDAALVDKVNELQKRVCDAETKSNNAECEIKILNSRVSSLVSTNSNLQSKLTETKRQLSSANNSLATERQNVQNAKKEADDAKKAMKAAKSKVGLHLFYIFVIVAISIIAFFQYQERLDKNYQNHLLSSKNSTLSEQISILFNRYNNGSPLIINSVSVRNSGEDYGDPISSNRTTYINPKIELFSLIDEYVEIYVKLFTPYGLSTGKDSPNGYTSSEEFRVGKNSITTCQFSGWGGEDEGYWESGYYRYEFYYKGNCIGSYEFEVH